jgi:hypothetical protein
MQMTITPAIVFQVSGAAIMVVAFILFSMNKGSGHNAVRVPGVEIQVSTPSVLMLLLGAALFVFPYSPWFHVPSANPPAPAAATNVTTSAGKMGDKMRSQGNESVSSSLTNAMSGSPAVKPDVGSVRTGGEDVGQAPSQFSASPSRTPVPGFPAPDDRPDWSIRIHTCNATKDLGQVLLRTIRPYGFHVDPLGVFPRDPMLKVDVVYAIDADKGFAEALAGLLSKKLGTAVGTDEINIAEGEQKVMYVFAGGDGCPGSQ